MLSYRYRGDPLQDGLPRATANKLGQPQVPSAGACEGRLPSFSSDYIDFTEVAKMNATEEFKLVIGGLYSVEQEVNQRWNPTTQ